mmetsp:Transcript_4805/g.11686  ORF Transcript_4805/g.11686 Transcript_4805/m.11686 type:complete len:179 (-) Transcript_4805:112-648(-)
MVHGKSRSTFEEAFLDIEKKLRGDTDALEYIKGYYDKADTFAHYHVRTVPHNLEKSSSQAPEANHSSIVSFVGGGSADEITNEFRALLNRNAQLREKHKVADARHGLRAAARAASGEFDNDPKMRLALCCLFQHGWRVFNENLAVSKKCFRRRLENGSDAIMRNGQTEEEASVVLGPG